MGEQLTFGTKLLNGVLGIMIVVLIGILIAVLVSLLLWAIGVF